MLTRRGFFGMIAALPAVKNWQVKPAPLARQKGRLVEPLTGPVLEQWHRVKMKPIDFYSGRTVYLSTLSVPEGW